jgi:hypothetical protein
LDFWNIASCQSVWFGRLDSDEEPDDFWGFDDEHKKKGKKHAISKNWLSSKNKLMETTSVRLYYLSRLHRLD